LVFRIQDRWLTLEIVRPERAARLPQPSILIFNYQGPYAALVVLRALSREVRARVAIAAEDRLWKGRTVWQGLLGAVAVQAFPFAKSGGAVRASLEETARWLDDGYSVIVSPEGEPEIDGELRPFLSGIGLMAAEMDVPVLPFRLEGYHRLFPRDPQFPYLHIRRGRARAVVGDALSFAKGTDYNQATEQVRRALAEAR
jgi:1-acyl-sn-glycerol-3-phosphate acyltransferase